MLQLIKDTWNLPTMRSQTSLWQASMKMGQISGYVCLYAKWEGSVIAHNWVNVWVCLIRPRRKQCVGLTSLICCKGWETRAWAVQQICHDRIGAVWEGIRGPLSPIDIDSRNVSWLALMITYLEESHAFGLPSYAVTDSFWHQMHDVKTYIWCWHKDPVNQCDHN